MLTSVLILAMIGRIELPVNIFNMTRAKLNCDRDVLIGLQWETMDMWSEMLT